MTYLLIIISLILDGILSIYIPETTYFLPLLTVITISNIYPLYKKKPKLYYTIIIMTGIIYDLIYTNLLIYHGITFMLIGYITTKLNKNIIENSINSIISTIITIVLYETITYVFVNIFKINHTSVTYLLNKISKTLILNIIYSQMIFRIIKLKAHKINKFT